MSLETDYSDALASLKEIAEDIRALRQFAEQQPISWSAPVSSARPLLIDKQERRHLYLLSAVSFELFFPDLAGQVGNPAQAPFSIVAGQVVELPFHTGDKLYCPAVAVANEITVLLIAQNEVLAL